jgi:hypothetical protein
VAADAAFYSARNEAATKAKGVKPDRGRTKLWCQEAFKAFWIHPIKRFSLNGLFRKQTAPAFMARARTLSLG